MKISKKRLQALVALESIVGNEFYNGKMQNWGPGGVYKGEGREFRYPVTFSEDDGTIVKTRSIDAGRPASVLMTGRYIVGSNQLSIMRALDRMIRYLEENHQLTIK